MKAILHQYQQYSVEWIEKNPYCALLLDMGLGKTLSSLTAIEELINTFGLVDRVLVIAPLSVATDTWPSEIDKWDHTKGLTFSQILGSKAKRLAALDKQADIYITNRENVVWLAEHYKTKWPFKTVIIDELSSFKASNSKRFKALRRVRPYMDRVIGLTGTPAPNTLIDLWPQIYLLDQGERLGKTITTYRNRYFYPGRSNGHVVYNWNLKPGAEQEIYEAISDIAVSMKARDYLNLPARINNTVEVQLNKREQVLYDQLEKDYVLELAQGETEIVASNAAVLSNKLLQMANGCIYDDEGAPQVIHDQKIEALKRIIEEAQGQPVLVFYTYKHDLARIKEAIPDVVDLDVKRGDVKKWNEGEIPILLAHPQSAGHGLNLQHGGHIVVWFGLTWSLEYYQQANARLDRQGQTESVIVHHLVARGTLDEHVMEVLAGKEQGQDALLDAVKAKIEKYSKKV